MRDETKLNLSDELKGKAVLASGTSRRLGEVTDAVVHPTEGRLLGLAVLTPAGKEHILDADEFLIGRDGVLAADDDIFGARGALVPREGAFALREIVGASVVTDGGQLVGRVSEVRVPLRGGSVEYEVAQTGVQRLLGGGLRLSAAAPHSFSRAGSRLIVSAGEMEHVSPESFEGGRGWLGLQSWRLTQSARLLLARYGVQLWFVVSVTLLCLMVWL